jgi:hypothetical protein
MPSVEATVTTPPVRLLEGRDRGPDHRGGGEQVDGDDPVPGLARDVGERAGHVHPGRGDHGVDAAPGLLDELPGGRLGGAGVGQVAPHPRHAVGGWLPVDDERAAAGLGDGFDDGGAEAARSAGDDDSVGHEGPSEWPRAAAMVLVVERPSR